MAYLPDEKCEDLLNNEYIDSDNEFCGGNIVNDERRRFKMKNGNDFEEIDPLSSWQNLTYIGSMNMGATICGVGVSSLSYPRLARKSADFSSFSWLENQLIHSRSLG